MSQATDLKAIRPKFIWQRAIVESSLPPTTRHVLLTISIYMGANCENGYPSTKRLAKDTGLSERTICTHTDIGVDTGFIRKRSRHKKGQDWRHLIYEALIEGAELGSVACSKGTEPNAEGTEPNDVKVLKEVQCKSTVKNTEKRGPSASPTVYEISKADRERFAKERPDVDLDLLLQKFNSYYVDKLPDKPDEILAQWVISERVGPGSPSKSSPQTAQTSKYDPPWQRMGFSSEQEYADFDILAKAKSVALELSKEGRPANRLEQSFLDQAQAIKDRNKQTHD